MSPCPTPGINATVPRRRPSPLRSVPRFAGRRPSGRIEGRVPRPVVGRWRAQTLARDDLMRRAARWSRKWATGESGRRKPCHTARRRRGGSGQYDPGIVATSRTSPCFCRRTCRSGFPRVRAVLTKAVVRWPLARDQTLARDGLMRRATSRNIARCRWPGDGLPELNPTAVRANASKRKANRGWARRRSQTAEEGRGGAEEDEHWGEDWRGDELIPDGLQRRPLRRRVTGLFRRSPLLLVSVSDAPATDGGDGPDLTEV